MKRYTLIEMYLDKSNAFRSMDGWQIINSKGLQSCAQLEVVYHVLKANTKEFILLVSLEET